MPSHEMINNADLSAFPADDPDAAVNAELNDFGGEIRAIADREKQEKFQQDMESAGPEGLAILTTMAENKARAEMGKATANLPATALMGAWGFIRQIGERAVDLGATAHAAAAAENPMVAAIPALNANKTIPDSPTMVEKGNVDLWNRKVLNNEDGSVSTTVSKSFEIDGNEVLLPTVVDGKKLTDEEAIQHHRDTGEHMGKWPAGDYESATQYATQVHDLQDQYVRDQGKPEDIGKDESPSDVDIADFFPEFVAGVDAIEKAYRETLYIDGPGQFTAAAEQLFQFVVPFTIGLGAAGGLEKINSFKTFATNAVKLEAASAAGAAFMEPHVGRFADFIKELEPSGYLLNQWINLAASDPDDSDAEGVFKNVVDNFFVSAPLTVVGEALVAYKPILQWGAKALRDVRNNLDAAMTPMVPGSPASQRGSISMNPADKEGAKAQIKALREKAKPFAEKGDLTAAEAAQFKSILNEMENVRFGILTPIKAEAVPGIAETKSTLSPDSVATAHADLIRNKDIYLPIREAAHGVSFGKLTAVDEIMEGKNAAVSARQLYDNFSGTREELRKQYGDTLTLYRATTKQMDKPTTNWATTEDFARQFGDKIETREIPVEDIIAVNVAAKGRYHELIVGKPPTMLERNGAAVAGPDYTSSAREPMVGPERYAAERSLLGKIEDGTVKGEDYWARPPATEFELALAAKIEESIGGGLSRKVRRKDPKTGEPYFTNPPISKISSKAILTDLAKLLPPGVYDGKKLSVAQMVKQADELVKTGHIMMPRPPGADEIIKQVMADPLAGATQRTSVTTALGAPRNAKRGYGTMSFKLLREAWTKSIDGLDNLLPKDRQRVEAEASALLKDQYNVNELVSKNLKLQKNEKTEVGTRTEPVKIIDDDGKEKGVESVGLNLYQSYSEKGVDICAKGAVCKDGCLGVTAGNNFSTGGGQDTSIMKGSRLAHFMATQAMLRDPEAFITVLQKEIRAAARSAREAGNKPSVRLNMLSDLPPMVTERLIKSNPDVMFYDYTKLDSDPIARNHHLTYSSTGLDQPKYGASNPHQNWKFMQKRLNKGQNITMVFSGDELPATILDEETGKIFKVIDGDTHDYRPLDAQPEGQPGVVVGLRNKDLKHKAKGVEAQVIADGKDGKGFVVGYDPKDGPQYVVAQQPKAGGRNAGAQTAGGATVAPLYVLPAGLFLQQFPHLEDYYPDLVAEALEEES